MGDGIAKAAKVGAAAFAATTTAIAGFVTASVKSYAEFEQLEGGVKKLFGTSSDTIMKYAQDAYKNAGLSANEYMTQITNFSASLISSLGGDTAAAVEIGNMAVNDMADNWDELKEAVSKVWDSIKEKTKEAVDKVVNWFGEMKQKASDKVNEMKQSVVDKFNEIKQNVSDKISAAKEAVVNKFTEIKTGITNKASEAKTAVVEKFEAIKSGISDKINSAKATVDSVFTSIKTSITDKINAAREGVHNAIEKIKSFFNFTWSLPQIKLPHFEIVGSFSLNPPSIPHFSVSWYKNGGVFDMPTMFGYGNGQLGGLGEDGAEAVVPLEKNTQWLTRIADMLSERMGGGGPIFLQVDGKTFAQISVDSINQLTRQTGSLPLRLV